MKREIPLTQSHRLLTPGPVVLLTTQYKGQVNVMSVAWVAPAGLQPPLVTIAIHPSAYTHDMLRRSEECVLNIPGRALAEQVLTCGTVSGKSEDKIALTGLSLEVGQRVESPWIGECLAHIECAVVDALTPGDHTMFIAEVVGAWAEEAAFDGTWLLPTDEEEEELRPLHHLGGKSFCLPGKRINLT
ncbi:MAG TPA: flavin reductase family protein [Chloroflexi bacterium]|nr:flavin reductase family protein [Chloroflexota bacterium]